MIMKIRAWDWIQRIYFHKEDKFYHRDVFVDRIPETFEDLLQTIRDGRITGNWDGKEHVEKDVKEDIIRKLRAIKNGMVYPTESSHWEFNYGYRSYLTIDIC